MSKGLGKPLKTLRAWDRSLQLFSVNEEFPVSASHQLALITSLPFVHTARRCYRLNDLEKLGLVAVASCGSLGIGGRLTQTQSLRGSKSRNKVSVGEPAEGSLSSLTSLSVFGWMSNLRSPIQLVFGLASRTQLPLSEN